MALESHLRVPDVELIKRSDEPPFMMEEGGANGHQDASYGVEK